MMGESKLKNYTNYANFVIDLDSFRELLKNPLIISDHVKTPISYKAPVIEFQVAFPIVSIAALNAVC